MILEGIVTTIDQAGEVNIAPMGPRVSDNMLSLILRPFPTSHTYRNLREHGEGVFHVTDDVLLLAKAAISPVSAPLVPAEVIRGHLLAEACRAYEFRVQTIDDHGERVEIMAEVVRVHRLRDFFGFNRAKHAIVEAAILATRLHLLPRAEIEAEFARLVVPIRKTGGPQEFAAFAYLQEYVAREGVP